MNYDVQAILFNGWEDCDGKKIRRPFAECSESTRRQIEEAATERFWSQVNKAGPLPDQSNPHYAGLDCCWDWTGVVNSKGYGSMRFCGKTMKATHIVWVLCRPDRPRGNLHVLHKCDRPRCCNPSHVFLGTNRENSQDMARKKRAPFQQHPEMIMRGENHPAKKRNGDYFLRGDKSPQSKLTAEKVIQMRRWIEAGQETFDTAGARFGVTGMAAWHACHRRGRTWRQIPFDPQTT